MKIKLYQNIFLAYSVYNFKYQLFINLINTIHDIHPQRVSYSQNGTFANN